MASEPSVRRPTSGAAPPGAVPPAAEFATSEEHDERASSRLAAETFMPIMVEAFHDGLKEVASLSRWLLATLVVINGAAVISVLPLKIDSALKLSGAVAFLLGIMTALGAALWSLYQFKRVSIAANTMMGYWLAVAGDGQRLAALEATMKKPSARRGPISSSSRA